MARKGRCALCRAQVEPVDYKDVSTLGRYLDRWNKIQPAAKTNSCSKHQRQIQQAIKRARFLALLPYTVR